MTLLSLLNQRLKIAKAFTKDFHDEIKQSLEDYDPPKGKKDRTSHDRLIKTKDLFSIDVRYIFATHESILSSLFEREMQVLFSGRGEEDAYKEFIVKAVYEYLYDVCDLDEFIIKSAWWFLLTGFVSSTCSFKTEVASETPQLDSNGDPMVDELGNPVMVPVYSYNDPLVEVDDMQKVYFAPDSEFSIDGKKVPYYISEKLVDPSYVEETYHKEVEATEELEVKGFAEKNVSEKSDLQRVKLYRYAGKLPKEIANEIEGYDPKKEYTCVFTSKEIVEVLEDEKRCYLAKWFSAPNTFFGFGLAKTLRDEQKEMSIRRGQMIRYADMYAYPWLSVSAETQVDQKALQDREKKTPLMYQGEKPEYIVPPALPDAIVRASDVSRSDAQFTSGTLDLSKGAQETNTVNTATGQQLFAQSQDKRVQKARKALATYFREVVIALFKLARDNWDEEKVIQITDDDGQPQEVTVSSESLQDIDFDKDIDISLENISVNKDILSQRVIAMYDKIKDDPLVNRRKIFAKMLREGFGEKKPEGYMLSEEEVAKQSQPQVQPSPDQEQQAEQPSPEMPTMGEQNAPQPY
jgi:hypothetical protein